MRLWDTPRGRFATDCSRRDPVQLVAPHNIQSGGLKERLRHRAHNSLGKLLPAVYAKLNISCIHCFRQSSIQVTSEMCFPPNEDSGYIGDLEAATVLRM